MTCWQFFPCRTAVADAGRHRSGVVLEGGISVTIFNAGALEPISDSTDHDRLGMERDAPRGLVDATDVVPRAPLEPIRLAGTLNASVSGQVVLVASEPVSEIIAIVSDFHADDGEAAIESANAKIHFAVRRSRLAIEQDIEERNVSGFFEDYPAGAVRYHSRAYSPPLSSEAPYHDILEPEPRVGQMVHPVWIVLRIPAGAEPGRYMGELRLQIAGEHSVKVPVELSTAGWHMPDPSRWVTHVGLIQSPESVARMYGADLWSDEHLEKLDASMRLIGQAGNNVVYIPLVSTNIAGNEHSMVKWVDRGGGEFTPDFSAVDRYLDVYERHHGPPSLVLVIVGETSMGITGRSPQPPDSMRVSSIDLEDGGLGHIEIPYPGLSGSHDFWAPAVEGVRRRVEERGWDAGAVKLGLCGDSWPAPMVIEFFREIAPGVQWAMYSHGHGMTVPAEGGSLMVGGVDIGCLVLPWPTRLADGEGERIGLNLPWKNDFLTAASARNFIAPYLEPAGFFVLAEAYTGGSRSYRGIDRIMADFWPVLPFRDARVSMCNASGFSDQLIHNAPRHILGFGENGALPTVRYRMLLEGLQAMEARIYIEKALLDEQARQIIGEEPALRAQRLLEERHNSFLRGRSSLNPMGREHRGGLRGLPDDYARSDVLDLTRRLYEMAAEFADVLDAPD